MTTLAEMTQIIARTISKVWDGVATSGSTTTLGDTLLASRLGHFNGGTIWVTQSGVTYSRIITSFANQVFTFSPALTVAVAAGVSYSAVSDAFPKGQLEQAVKESLLKLSVLKIDTSATVTEGADVTLPTGVSDVRRVFVAGVECFHWYEMAGKLRFDKTTYTGALEIHYAARPTTPTSDTSVIDAAIGDEWLHWAAVGKLWRDYYRDNHKDNPTAIELFNEARQNEQSALNAMRTLGILAPTRSPHHSSW